MKSPFIYVPELFHLYPQHNTLCQLNKNVPKIIYILITNIKELVN